MDQRTCRSYSLPCFSFPALVDGVDSDVVRGHWLQAPHDGGSGRLRDLEDHFFPPAAGNILQPIMADPARRRHPCYFHGLLGLVGHDQPFMSGGG